MKIYLIRHTAVDVDGICYGQTDVPLKETFEAEAGLVKKKLKDISPDAVFSSPLNRCRRLTHYCGFNNAILDDRLKELNFGDWEGQRWDEIDMSVWAVDWVNPPAPRGESFMQMYHRVAAFFDELKDRGCNTVFVFTHGGVISCARVYFENVDIKKTFDLMPRYGEIVTFSFDC